MKPTVSSSLLALVLVATNAVDVQAAAIDFSVHPWIAPGSNDSRGPCPGLNTYVPSHHLVFATHFPVSLANHGILPRNGRNISVPMLVKAGLGMFDNNSVSCPS